MSISNEIPVTEQSNNLTKLIDNATSDEILQLLSQTDRQLFNFGDNRGLYNPETIKNVEIIANLVRENLEKPTEKFKIILSGCGTSGRLAYIVARSINKHLKRDLCDYIIAGDDYALINSVEAVEDDPICGSESLKSRIKTLDSYILIAITCGLSAPFCAGQMDHCLNDTKCAASVLIGFNPITSARKIPVKFDGERVQTFADVLAKCLKSNNFYLLNPIVGPEPITGSTRMKSGSATKILLDLIFLNALDTLNSTTILSLYEGLLDNVIYEATISRPILSRIINSGAQSLNSNSSINYSSKNRVIGILGCIDASECVPTYGAERDDIRGFIDYESSGNDEYLSELEQFKDTHVTSTHFLNALSDPKSTIIEIDESLIENKEKPYENLAQIYTLFDKYVKNKVEFVSKNVYLIDCLRLMTAKLCLNAISTGSHVRIGKTYENYMIDVKTSNIKLYKRAIHIINLLSKHKENSEDSELCLLKAIYNTNNLNSIDKTNISSHIQIAKDEKLVVPKALIIKLTGCTIENAINELKTNNSVRQCIQNIIKK